MTTSPPHPSPENFRKDSKLWFRKPGALFELRVRTNKTKKFRRQVLLLLFRAMKKELRELSTLELTHSDASLWAICRDMDRRVSLHQSMNLDTNEETQGFEIRMKRLHYGFTQKEFAELVGIARVHLSRLERGRVKMSPRTRTAIDEAFRRLRRGYTKLQMLTGKRGGEERPEDVRHERRKPLFPAAPVVERPRAGAETATRGARRLRNRRTYRSPGRRPF
jgi:transcriptional regulator with XRE-family HTH domain